MRRHRPGVVRVAGPSMEPTLRHGDLLLVWWGGRAAPGRMVVFRHPIDGVLTVKRVARADPDDPRRWWVERDNPQRGSDSWSFGSIAEGDILGRVLTLLPRSLRGG